MKQVLKKAICYIGLFAMVCSVIPGGRETVALAGESYQSAIDKAKKEKEAKKKAKAQRKEVAQMLKTIGQLTLERDFLQDCFCRTGRAIPEFDPDRF